VLRANLWRLDRARFPEQKVVTFQCSSCGGRTPVPINSLSEVPQQCNSCQAIWWRSNDFATHVSTSGPAATAFIQAIRVIAAMIRDKKDTFRILFENTENHVPYFLDCATPVSCPDLAQDQDEQKLMENRKGIRFPDEPRAHLVGFRFLKF
jgi:DNA replicative helicase MCM subunit Mcm2 (Cdc46/Mcm family)